MPRRIRKSVVRGSRQFVGTMSEHNPWLSIWTQPRATIRKIITVNPKRSLWLLAAIYGFSSLLNSFQSATLGTQMGMLPIFLIALILSPIWGFIVFGVWSWVVSWTGKWLKGRGDFQEVRAAYAWSCVPLTINGLLWIVMILIFGHVLFLNFPEGHALNNGQATALFLILIAKVVLAIWSLVIYLNALAEVQQFSVLRAIGNVILSGIIIGVVLGILWTLSLYAMGAAVGSSHTTFHILHEGKLLEALRISQGGL